MATSELKWNLAERVFLSWEAGFISMLARDNKIPGQPGGGGAALRCPGIMNLYPQSRGGFNTL
jgi:hypothetical protein